MNLANEKNKPKSVSGQSIARRRHFVNFNFYKVMYGKWASSLLWSGLFLCLAKFYRSCPIRYFKDGT